MNAFTKAPQTPKDPPPIAKLLAQVHLRSSIAKLLAQVHLRSSIAKLLAQVHLRSSIAKLSSIGPFALLGLLGAIGCSHADEPTAAAPAPPPHTIALSTYDAQIGAVVQIYGTNFADGRSGRMQLVLDGHFRGDDGAVEPVHNVVDARYIDASTLAWETFGPYNNPMSASGNKTGTFEGTLTTQLARNDGSMLLDAKPPTVSFHVQPSILVRDMQPVGATCAEPAARGLGGFVYHLSVAAIGFTPTVFTYSVSAPALTGVPSTAFRRPATKDGAEFDDVTLPDLPAGTVGYTAVIRIDALDTKGITHTTAFALGVHRPMEINYDGNISVAETFAPVPVSGCIPGGDNGRDATYNEETTDTRTRHVSQTWDQGWVTQHTSTTGTTTTNETSHANEVSVSTTDGQTFGWSQSHTSGSTNTIHDNFQAGGTFFGLVTASASGGYDHASMSANMSGTMGSTEHSTMKGSASTDTYSHSEATTNTSSDAVSKSQSVSTGTGIDTTTSISQLRGFSGTIIAGRYGVFYRQTVRLTRRASVVVFNLCGEPQKVADLEMQDWEWSPDLAEGSSCVPLPASTLPPAQCIVSPCTQGN